MLVCMAGRNLNILCTVEFLCSIVSLFMPKKRVHDLHNKIHYIC